MSIVFKKQNHIYESVDEEIIQWESVTKLLHRLKPPFDSDKIAAKCSRDKKSKWYGLSPEEIKAEWKRKNHEAITRGSWYHDMIENLLTGCDTIVREGVTLKIFKPLISGEVKIAPNQKLEEGIYPEHLVYLKSAALIGQSDKVEVINGYVNIGDLKTNEEIKFKSYVNWEGISNKLAFPVNHLDDCNWFEYCLQLSLYMYMVLKHNPRLKAGKITISHILFKRNGEDKFGNPTYEVDNQGNYIVEDVIDYDVPYLKQECIALINWRKDQLKKISQ